MNPEIPKTFQIRLRVQKAYKVLRKLGYVCRSNFMCCSSCANAEIADKLNKKGIPETEWKCVFWHRQDEQALFANRYGEGEPCLYLAWTGDGKEVRAAMETQGLTVRWDGTKSDRIMVTLTDEQMKEVAA